MAWHRVGAIEASYRKPNWQPEGPLGWGFWVESEPVDGGAPHGQLLAAVAASFPTLDLTLSEADSSGNYLDGIIGWEGSEVILWAERLEGILYAWSLQQEPVERLRSEILRRAPAFF